ncbi:HD-GYP domain-containing protein, partial [uncultured Thiodictyon sp.]
AIPLQTRMVSIADVFDALTSRRPYKKAWPFQEAQDHIQAGSGSHFDPGLVPLFMDIMPEVLAIRGRYQD